jgi:addiction module RelE/StbE family toxin
MRIEWTFLAMNDREAIFDYLEADSPRAAIMIDDRIEAQVELLIETPEIGRPGRIEGTRELVIQRTPYIAAYRIDGETVSILRVLHGAQEWPDELQPSREM